VERVAELRSSEPQRIDGIFNDIAELVVQAQTAMRSGQTARLGQLMNENHALLQQLTVSTVKLDEACELARQAGALGAKLTGSGGGGCVIALCESSAEPVLSAWKSRKLSCFSITIQSHG
jgi:mevalonate kinase